MFSAASVSLFVCQHDNFRTGRHRMMKLGGRCTVQTSRPSSSLGVIALLGCAPPKCGVGLRRWEHQRTLSSFCSVVLSPAPPHALPSLVLWFSVLVLLFVLSFASRFLLLFLLVLQFLFLLFFCFYLFILL